MSSTFQLSFRFSQRFINVSSTFHQRFINVSSIEVHQVHQVHHRHKVPGEDEAQRLEARPHRHELRPASRPSRETHRIRVQWMLKLQVT